MISNKIFNSTTTKVKVTATYAYLARKNKELPLYIHFSFYPNKKRRSGAIGWVQLNKLYGKKITYETHSQITDASNMGRGLGLFMYTTAMDWAAKHGLIVTSYTRSHQSSFARRLWRSKRLRESYSITKYPKENRWLAKPKKVTFRLPQIIKDVKL